MHLPVNGAGQDKEAGAAVAFAGRRGVPAHTLHRAIGDENVAVLYDPIWEDYGSNKDFVRHESNSRSTGFCDALAQD
jgi:hypothetical protein